MGVSSALKLADWVSQHTSLEYLVTAQLSLKKWILPAQIGFLWQTQGQILV